jgi:hypothetical protein
VGQYHLESLDIIQEFPTRVGGRLQKAMEKEGQKNEGDEDENHQRTAFAGDHMDAENSSGPKGEGKGR